MVKLGRLSGLVLLSCAVATLTRAQTTLFPGDTALRPDYIKERNVFQKLIWLDSTGVITRTAILNLVTKIDTVGHKVTYLQIRNDGKRDSSISSYPGLEPLYLSTQGSQFIETYDYRKKGLVAIHTEKGGRVTYDGNESVAPGFFESYLTDLVMTALPLEQLKPLQYYFYNTNLRQRSVYGITKINQDVLLGLQGHNVPVYVLTVSTGKNEFLVYMEKMSHQILRTVFVAPNGASFIKELL